MIYFAHGGEQHAAESAVNPVSVAIAVVVIAAVVAALIYMRKRKAAQKNSDSAE